MNDDHTGRYARPNPLCRSGVLAVGISLIGLFAMAGCSTNTAPTANHSQTGANNADQSGEVLNPSTIDDLFASIAKSGLPAPNPRDVTQRDCPRIGCLRKIETDTVSIAKFPTTGRAEQYAGSTHHVFLIEDVVMSFAGSVPPGQDQEYERAVKRAIE